MRTLPARAAIKVGAPPVWRSSWKMVRLRSESVFVSEDPIQIRNPSKSWIMVRGCKRPAVLLQPRTMSQDFEGFRIWIGSSDTKTDSLRNLTIFQLYRQTGGAPTLIAARAGKVRMDSTQDAWVFSLRDGQTHTPDRDKPANYLDIRFSELDVNVPNVDSRLHRTDKGYRGDREMPIEEMAVQKREAEHREKTLVHDHSERVFSDVRWIQSLLELDSASRARPKDTALRAVTPSETSSNRLWIQR